MESKIIFYYVFMYILLYVIQDSGNKISRKSVISVPQNIVLGGKVTIIIIIFFYIV